MYFSENGIVGSFHQTLREVKISVTYNTDRPDPDPEIITKDYIMNTLHQP